MIDNKKEEKLEITDAIIEFEKGSVDYYIGDIPTDFIKPITYIIQRDGIWEIRKNEIGIFTRQVVEKEFYGLPLIVDYTLDELFVPKIPIIFLGQSVSFFRYIYNKFKTESYLDIYYDEEKKEYYIYCPEQKVSYASVDWEVNEKDKMPKGIKVLELHSHCDFESYFSTVDDKDEKGDRYYGVVGDLDKYLPDVNFRVVIGGEEFDIDIEDIFDIEDDTYYSEFPEEWKKKVTRAAPKVVKIKNNLWKDNKFNKTAKPIHIQTYDDLMLEDEDYEQFSSYMEEYYHPDYHLYEHPLGE